MEKDDIFKKIKSIVDSNLQRLDEIEQKKRRDAEAIVQDELRGYDKEKMR
jgi:hypothetical protein